MNENKLDCAIVRDLLPLYHDDVVSEVTKTAVAGHLSECADCAVEFLKLRTELPEVKEVTPKKKFMDLLRTRRRYRILAAALAVVLVCGLLFGMFLLQAQFPVVHIPGEEFTVERVYRYETEEEIRYFLIVTGPMYGGMRITTDMEVWTTGNDGSMALTDDVLAFNAYRPLISGKFGTRSEILIVGCGWETGDNGIDKHDYQVLSCFNEMVKTSELAEIEVPGYVYAYDRVYEQGGFSSLNLEDNWIGIEGEDGVVRYWDLDGNELEGIQRE